MKRLALCALAVALAFSAPPALAEDGVFDPAPVLRQQVVVSGDVVHLSDVFDGVDVAADPIVAYAPAPGRRAVFDANWLARVAQRNGLTWRPASRLDRVIVERATLTLGADEITEILRQEPAIQDLGQDVEVALANRSARIFLPADAPGAVTVESLSVDSETGRFRAALRLDGDDGRTNQRVNLAGRVYPVMQIPVPAATLRPGEIIGDGDITWMRVRTASVRDNVASGLDQLVGRTPRRPLSPDMPIRLTDIVTQDAVTRGTGVTIVFQTKAMTLTAAGRALDSGARDEVIRVQNLQSGKTIDAKVLGPDRVAVFAPNQLADAQFGEAQ